MRAKREAFEKSPDLSFRLLLNPNLNDIFYWHFHPEYEIVYVEAEKGLRHIGDHISKYEGSDLALIGPNIPHLNFDYGVKTKVDTVVIQMAEGFLGKDFFSLAETAGIKDLFERSKSGIAFFGGTKKQVGESLKKLPGLPHFERLITLLQLLHILAASKEAEDLHTKPIANASVLKEQQRLQRVYHYIERNYQQNIDVNEVAAFCHLTTAAFCRYFKKSTHYTFTDFLNQYRINQSKKILLHDTSISGACYESGFGNISHFNKTFKKITGETPSSFRKRNWISL